MYDDIFEIIKYKVKPTQFARIVLGAPSKKSGSTLFYYSPLRVKERTPSLAVNDEEGITDFGTGRNHDIISFVSEYEGCSSKTACYRIADLCRYKFTKNQCKRTTYEVFKEQNRRRIKDTKRNK